MIKLDRQRWSGDLVMDYKKAEHLPTMPGPHVHHSDYRSSSYSKGDGISWKHILAEKSWFEGDGYKSELYLTEYVIMRGSRYSMRMRLGSQNWPGEPPPQYSVSLLVAQRYIAKLIATCRALGFPKTLRLKNPPLDRWNRNTRQQSIAYWLASALCSKRGLEQPSERALRENIEYSLKMLPYTVWEIEQNVLLVHKDVAYEAREAAHQLIEKAELRAWLH